MSDLFDDPTFRMSMAKQRGEGPSGNQWSDLAAPKMVEPAPNIVLDPKPELTAEQRHIEKLRQAGLEPDVMMHGGIHVEDICSTRKAEEDRKIRAFIKGNFGKEAYGKSKAEKALPDMRAMNDVALRSLYLNEASRELLIAEVNRLDSLVETLTARLTDAINKAVFPIHVVNITERKNLIRSEDYAPFK